VVSEGSGVLAVEALGGGGRMGAFVGEVEEVEAWVSSRVLGGEAPMAVDIVTHRERERERERERPLLEWGSNNGEL
jgi:hypothetical protein